MAQPVSVSVQARGMLRVLWAQLENDARRIESAADKVPRPLLVAAARKGKVGAQRAMSRIFAGMPLLPFHAERRCASFRFLKPVAEVPAAIGGQLEAGDQQPAVIMMAILINAGHAGRLLLTPLGGAWTFHALARLLDRSAFSADPITAMFECHKTVAASSTPHRSW